MNDSFKIILLTVIFSLTFPFLAQGAIIPCVNDCDFGDLLHLVDNVIDWIIIISVPVAAGVFAWAGMILMTTGIADKKSQAKAMLWKVFLGFVAILSAWIIVSTVLDALLNSAFRGSIGI